jgi:hypothetical protein
MIQSFFGTRLNLSQFDRVFLFVSRADEMGG